MRDAVVLGMLTATPLAAVGVRQGAAPTATAGAGVVPDAPVTTEAVQALATSEHGMLVLAQRSLTVLDAAGRRARRRWFGASLSPPVSRAVAGGVSWSGEDLPLNGPDGDWARGRDLEDLDDPDDPVVADVAETVMPVRGARARLQTIRDTPPTLAIRRPRDGVIAAGGRFGWLGQGDGLWRIDLETGAEERAALPRREPVYKVTASADGRVVAAVAGNTLYASDDGGQTFEATGGRVTAPRALAATNGGEVFLIDGDGRALRVPAATRELDQAPALLAPNAIDLAGCGDWLILLTATSILTVAKGGVTTLMDAPRDAGRVACDARGRSWAVGGPVHHWRSGDGVWHLVPNPPGAATALAITTDRLWIATSSGLWAVRVAEATAAAPANAGHLGDGDGGGPGGPPRGAPPPDIPQTRGPETVLLRSTRWWAPALPRVDLLFAAARTAGRRDLRGIVVLTFALGGGSAQAARAAAERLREARVAATDHAARMRAIDAAATVAGEEDRISADERAALIRALKETVP